MSDIILSKWHQELDIFRKIKPCLILEGNVLDSYMYPHEGSIPKGSIVRLPDYLHYYFKDAGYENIVMYDGIHGFYNKTEEGYLEKFSDIVGAKASGKRIIADFQGKGENHATALIEKVVTQNEHASVVIMDFASRYVCEPSNLQRGEIDGFTILMQAALDAQEVRTEKGILKNLVVLIVSKLNDVPAWYYLDNPNVKAILLKTPTKEERTQMVKGHNFRTFFTSKIYQDDYPYYEIHADELEKIQDRFVGLTDGFSFTELNGLRRLCKNQEIRIRDMCSVIDLYKFGIKENPWNKLDPDDFADAYADFEKRVKGQPSALTQTLDVIKRAMTGMADISSTTHGKPKGVLFFAGPTGTGKTETAKTIAEKLFGDESACIRFDTRCIHDRLSCLINGRSGYSYRHSTRIPFRIFSVVYRKPLIMLYSL